jgi:hypothetical protein
VVYLTSDTALGEVKGGSYDPVSRALAYPAAGVARPSCA